MLSSVFVQFRSFLVNSPLHGLVLAHATSGPFAPFLRRTGYLDGFVSRRSGKEPGNVRAERVRGVNVKDEEHAAPNEQSQRNRVQPVWRKKLGSEGGQLSGSSPSRRRGDITTEKRKPTS